MQTTRPLRIGPSGVTAAATAAGAGAATRISPRTPTARKAGIATSPGAGVLRSPRSRR